MDRENSDETDRFLRAIAALSSASDDMTDRGRRITGKDGPHIASLIGEISETVLHRRLQFQSGADETLTIEVNERRLLRLSALPDRIQTQWPRIVCNDLSETDADEVLAALSVFCQDANDLFVRSVTIKSSPHLMMDGTPVVVKIVDSETLWNLNIELPEALSLAMSGEPVFPFPCEGTQPSRVSVTQLKVSHQLIVALGQFCLTMSM